LKNDIIKKIKQGGLSLFINNILTVISQVVFIVILSKFLKPSDFGYQGTCIILLELTLVFTYPSINKSIILKKQVSKEFIDHAILLSLLLCVGFGLLYLIASGILFFYLSKPDLAFICFILFLMLIIKGIYQPHQSLFEKELRFKETSRYSLIAYWIGYFLVPIVLAFLHFGFKSLILGLLVYEIIMLIFYIKNYNFKFTTLNKIIVKEIFLDTKHLIINSFFNQLATNGDYYVVSTMLGTKALGYYSQGYKIMKMPTTLIGNIINNMSFASLSKFNEDNEKLSKAFIYMSFILALFSFPIFIICFFYSNEIVLLLLGEKWMPTASVLKIFSLGIFLRMSYKIPGTILRAKSQFSLTAKLQILYAFNVIVISLLFIKMSINGVAIATLIALIIQYILLTYFVNKTLNKNPFYFYGILIKPLLFSVVFLIMHIIFMSFWEHIFHLNHLINFVVSTILVVLLASLALFKYGMQLFGNPFVWWVGFLNRK